MKLDSKAIFSNIVQNTHLKSKAMHPKTNKREIIGNMSGLRIARHIKGNA